MYYACSFIEFIEFLSFRGEQHVRMMRSVTRYGSRLPAGRRSSK